MNRMHHDKALPLCVFAANVNKLRCNKISCVKMEGLRNGDARTNLVTKIATKYVKMNGLCVQVSGLQMMWVWAESTIMSSIALMILTIHPSVTEQRRCRGELIGWTK